MKKTILILWVFISTSSTWAAERDVYSFDWLDPDKEVYVLQNRKYRKHGKMLLNIGGGLTTSGAFVNATALQARAGYFVREEFGFEYIFSKNKGKENKTARSVRNEGVAGSVPFRRIVKSYMGGMFMFSPFYGKLNLFNGIVYTDWLLGIGYVELKETNNRNEFLGNAFEVHLDKQVKSHGGLIWSFGKIFYLSRNFSLRFDTTTVHYKAVKPNITGENKKIWYSNWDSTLSFGFSF